MLYTEHANKQKCLISSYCSCFSLSLCSQRLEAHFYFKVFKFFIIFNLSSLILPMQSALCTFQLTFCTFPLTVRGAHYYVWLRNIVVPFNISNFPLQLQLLINRRHIPYTVCNIIKISRHCVSKGLGLETSWPNRLPSVYLPRHVSLFIMDIYIQYLTSDGLKIFTAGQDVWILSIFKPPASQNTPHR